MVAAEDFTVLGGSIGSGSMAKRYRICQLALQERVPLVFMLDGAGHRLTDTGGGRTPNDLLSLADCSGNVPMLCLVLGASAGHGALTSPLSDFTVMTQSAAMFTGGPPLVKAATGEDVSKEELGGAKICAEIAGSAHNVAEGDEAALARKAARLYGSDHREIPVRIEELRERMPDAIRALDQPSVDGINTYFVSEAAVRAGLKVAVSGVGGDELFGGYPSFNDIPRWRRICALPSRIPGLGRAARGVLTALWPLLPGSSPKLPGMLEHGGTWAGAYLLRRGLYLPHELPAILDPETVERGLARLAAPMGAGLAGLLEHSPLADMPRISLMESALYMRNQLLRDVDWASMAHSLEVRTPLVDKDLLRAIRPIQEGLGGKRALGEALDLPAELLDRPKTGFTTPIGEWIAADLPEFSDGVPWARSWAREVAGVEICATPEWREAA